VLNGWRSDSEVIKKGGAQHGRHASPPASRSTLTPGPCSNSLYLSVGGSFRRTASAVPVEPMMNNWDFRKVNKEEILHDYKQKPGAFIPEFVALDDLVEIYLNNPGFHSSFEDFMDEWQEEDNTVECEF
jgi:hypothetical protein